MKARPAIFPVGHETLSWIRLGGSMNHSDWLLRFSLYWQSFWFDYNYSLQRRLQPDMWTGDNPIFIMGVWRSGTTLMHELLGACPEMIWPNTWQCMNPSSLLRTSSLIAAKTVTRPMDGFTIDTLSPQEDEFALLALGIPSVYRAFFDPRRLHEVAQWLDPTFWVARTDGWVETWRSFLGRIAEGRQGRLLLKSPNHTYRVRALVKEFPNATYVWMVRNPGNAFLSNRKMWRAMFSHYALWEWDDSALDAFLEKAFNCAAESLFFATESLSRKQLVVVDFDIFMQSPVATIEAICKRLDLGSWDIIKPFVVKEAEKTASYRKNDPGQTLYPVPTTEVNTLEIVQGRALNSHGLLAV